MSQLDIRELVGGETLVVRPEEEDERQARVERENKEHALRLEKERAMFYGAGMLFVAGLIGSFTIAVQSTNPEVQKWAMSLVTLLGGALAGFVTGKQTK
jgi:hypothetical protein